MYALTHTHTHTHPPPHTHTHPQLQTALPAMLVYQGGRLVGNLLRVSESLKDEFSEEDVEIYLQE